VTTGAAKASVVVRYSVRPEAVEEHLRLVHSVFAALASQQVAGVAYAVHRGDDGTSFVHVATFDEAGVNPLPGLPEFQDFTRDLASRVTAPPVSSAGHVLASYA
jgi:hypothetical protein